MFHIPLSRSLFPLSYMKQGAVTLQGGMGYLRVESGGFPVSEQIVTSAFVWLCRYFSQVNISCAALWAHNIFFPPLLESRRKIGKFKKYFIKLTNISFWHKILTHNGILMLNLELLLIKIISLIRSWIKESMTHSSVLYSLVFLD